MTKKFEIDLQVLLAHVYVSKPLTVCQNNLGHERRLDLVCWSRLLVLLAGLLAGIVPELCPVQLPLPAANHHRRDGVRMHFQVSVAFLFLLFFVSLFRFVLFVCLFLLVCLFLFVLACLIVCLFVCLLACLFVCLFVCVRYDCHSALHCTVH